MQSQASPTAGPAALADEAMQLVGCDPRSALAKADAAAHAARGVDQVAESTAHRAAGLALRELGRLATAHRRATTAVRVAAHAGAAQAEAEARMSLAFVLLERGRIGSALDEADRAATSLRALPGARVQSQRALILQRAGRFDDALAAFKAALPILRRHQDILWEARLRNNRGLLQADRGALAAAESDLLRAREIYVELGREVFVADADWNLGLVAARAGDAPAALRRYADADAVYGRHQVVHPSLMLDRAQVLMSVGLFGEARAAAGRDVEAARASGHRSDLPEALLLVAQADLALGEAAEAGGAARAARQQFSRQHRVGWARLARFVELRAAEARGTAAPALVRSAMGCADELAAAGWTLTELDCRLTVAAAALRAGNAPLAREQLARAASARRSASLDLRSRAWFAEAQLREADGRRSAAMSALRCGMAAVWASQDGVGATEFRVHTAGHGAALARFGLALAIEGGRASAVLAWAERWRASSLRLQPARPPADAGLAAALADVRRLSAEMRAAQLAGQEPTTVAELRAAEDRVRHASRTTESPFHRPPGTPPPAAELAAALGDRVLVEYVLHDGALLAVTLRSGRCRLHRLGPAVDVQADLDAAHFALRRMAGGFGSGPGQERVRSVFAAAGVALDDLLVGPLRHEIGERPLLVVPTGFLHPTPWALLPSLARVPVLVAPSAASWLRAHRRQTAPRPGSRRPRVLLAAGPDLASAPDEIGQLVGLHPTARRLTGPQATVEAVTKALDGADLAHVAAHGRLRRDNPLFSSLELADGPLTVYDLEQLRRPPRRVVLPACHSGRAAVHAGDETMGLVSALLALGTETVVATVAPVNDAATTELMVRMHEGIGAGRPPVDALEAARRAVDGDDPAMAAAMASFVCFGA